MHIKDCILGLGLLTAGSAAADVVMNFPMDIVNGTVKETVSGYSYRIQGNFAPMSVKSPQGTAWRTDGYTSHIRSQALNALNGTKMTATVAFAIDTYSIILQDNNDANNQKVSMVTCLDEGARTGFGFYLGRTGKYSFRTYVGNELVEVLGDGIIPLWEWTQLSATVDGGSVNLYCNGRKVGSRSVNGSGVKLGNGELLIGRDKTNNNDWCGARTADFNGAIDYIEVRNDVVTPSYTSTYADLNLPADRYESDRLRARYHGQPGMNWTNETHGLYYNAADGKYHVFFQRTGSAPVMSHAHWGHIVSDNLYDWRDDTPAIAPSESYDLRGCWSGCLFTDDQITGGKPAILYTGVGYGPGESYAALARCTDPTHLRKWTKDASNPIDRYSNTQRDTYFFRTDASHAYFVIGDEGCLKLYRYDNGRWVADGNFFTFSGNGESGFTEMPNISKLDNGKWLVTTTPWTGEGVVCYYRIGDINAQGRFTNYTNAEKFDLFARDGYGLMSPSIGRDKNGKMIALGIVADKMETQFNLSHGYAHLYSLPRELSVDAAGKLCQKPFPGYEGMRGAVNFKMPQQTINGTVSLNPVRGRQAEICATFEVGDAAFGFNFYKDARGKTAYVQYNPANHEVKIDFSAIARVPGSFDNGIYSAILPIYPSKGQDMKLQLFIDHSIVDLFVNDRYAASVRIFPDDDDADLIEVFARSATKLKSLEAYMLGDGDASSTIIEPEKPEVLESTGKVGLYVGFANANALKASSHKEEIAVYNYFTERYGADHVIFAGETNRIDANTFDCIWVNLDRMNLGDGRVNLPAEFASNEFKNALSTYLANGGNLYLTKHATHLAYEIGRTSHHPNIVGSGDGGQGNDVWKINICNNGNDYTSHPIFQNIPTVNEFGMEMIDMLGNTSGLWREDHNCLWAMNDYGGYRQFTSSNSAKVLATWGHNGGDAMDFAGIVEFSPKKSGNRAIAQSKVDARRGTLLANGVAAYEWAPRNGGVNIAHANIVALTDNVLKYLSPKAESEASEMAFTTEQGRIFGGYGEISFQGFEAGTQVKAFAPDGTMILDLIIDGDCTLTTEYRGLLIVSAAQTINKIIIR